MALRAFHCNPALGGFGDETETTTTASTGGLRRVSFSCASSNKKKPSSSAVHATAFEPRPAANSSSESLLANNSGGGDAFAQIIKELVDNAVDACNDLTHQNCYNGNKKNPGSDALKKVTVVIDKVESDDKFVKAEYYAKCDPDHDSSSAAGVFTNHRELLRVVVSDNGCGMEDVEKCVSVFSSSKNQDDFISCSGGAVTINDTTASKNSQQPAVLGTAGRYGLGLTLCILHAQRLVPNSCVIIESTVQNSATMTKFKFIVDTERDAVVCLHREDCVKKEISVSGTSVSLLLPVSNGKTSS
jgi:DNA topoisomerase VI, subunit B